MGKNTAVLGAGNVGTALALVLAGQGHRVRMYSIEPDVTADINRRHRNAKYLQGVGLPRNISADDDLKNVLQDADIVILAVPSFALKEVVAKAAPHLSSGVVIGSITKGLDPISLKPLGATVSNLLPERIQHNYCLIGGPAIANEIARRTPSAVVVASANPNAAKKLAAALQGEAFKAGTSQDVVGVGYAMALKNVYAIALGLTQGLGYPMNTQALILTQAIMELGQFLKACGAEPETAMSLAGLGDLMVTGFSPHGRNRTYGEKLVKAKSKDPLKMGLKTVEGISAAPITKKLARKHKIKAPLFEAVLKCLDADRDFSKPFVRYLKELRLK
jgi:glycerol-3-phosphate dehydrogenase (NAD(P)+)